MSSYVGIDVAKLELVVHVLPQEQGKIFANSAAGLAELVNWRNRCRVSASFLKPAAAMNRHY